MPNPLWKQVCLVTTKLKKVSRYKLLMAEFSSTALGLKKGAQKKSNPQITLYRNIRRLNLNLVLRFPVPSLGPAGESQHFTSLLQGASSHPTQPSPLTRHHQEDQSLLQPSPSLFQVAKVKPASPVFTQNRPTPTYQNNHTLGPNQQVLKSKIGGGQISHSLKHHPW